MSATDKFLSADHRANSVSRFRQVRAWLQRNGFYYTPIQRYDILLFVTLQEDTGTGDSKTIPRDEPRRSSRLCRENSKEIIESGAMSRRDRAVLRACIDFSRLGRASNRQSDGKRERERERVQGRGIQVVHNITVTAFYPAVNRRQALRLYDLIPQTLPSPPPPAHPLRPPPPPLTTGSLYRRPSSPLVSLRFLPLSFSPSLSLSLSGNPSSSELHPRACTNPVPRNGIISRMLL